MFVAAADEALIEVRAVRGEDVFAFEGAADEGDACIHDEGPHQEGAEHEGVAAFTCGEERQDGEGVTEEGAACVAHEDLGGRPVMKEKTQTARGDGEGDPIDEVIVCARGEEHPTEGGGEGDPARDAVDAVHEIVGVGETDDPQDGDDEADRAKLQLTEERNGDGFEIAHAKHGRERDQSLHCKTDARTKRMEVVSPAEVGNDRAADKVDDAMNEV